jgi:hypothetical protein
MVCRIMHWTIPDLLALDLDVYDELIDMLEEEARLHSLE